MRTRAEGFSKRLAGLILAAGAAMLFVSPAARAQTCTVNATTETGGHSSGTAGDILYCVMLANATPANLSTLINFDPSLNGQTITLSSTLSVAPTQTGVTINIQGPGANLLTISGGYAVEPFSILSATVNISGLTIANGYSSGNAGGIYNSGGTLTVSNTTFSGNTGLVGGIFNVGTLTVSGSTFSNNNASFAGGGIFNELTAVVTNSTFEGNSAGGGGAIENGGGGVLTVNNSTFSGNGGGAINNVGAATVTNTIMIADSSVECIGSGCPYNGFNGNVVVANPAQPILAPLGWYGGSTQTMIPLPGSVAIGAGMVTATDNPSTDQRGLFRDSTIGASVDAGAVQTNYLIVTTTNDTNDGTPGCDSNGDVPCSLRDAMTIAQTAPYISGADIGFASGVTGTIDLSVVNTPLATISGVLDLVGPGANNLTVSGGNSANVDAIFALTSATANATISGLTIANGHASINSSNCLVEAGGLCTNSGTLTVSNSTVSGSSSGLAGGITNGAGTLMVINSTVSGNTGGFGGGIYNGATAIVSGSTVSGNFSSVCGGGIYQVEGTLMVTNSTVAGNTMVNTGGNFGGGICTDHGTLTVINSTVSGNLGAAGGGGIYNLYATSLTLSNSIVAGNMNILTPGDDCDGCGTQTASNLISTPGTMIDPMLASLGNYGGPTQTMLPVPGSPAICLGSAALASSLTTDQRGYPRINTSYAGYSAANPCVDAGAVQTNFQSVQFTNAGNSGYSTTINAAVDEPAAPIVSVIENGQSVGGVALTLGFNGTGAASGLGPVTTVANAGAHFDALTVNSAGDDMLSVMLPLPGGNSLQATASLNVTNSVLTITASDTTTVYGSTPPAPVAEYTYGNVTLSTTPPNGLTAPTCVTSATSTTPVGTDTGANTCAGASGSNYKISYAAGNVMVSVDNTTTAIISHTPNPSAVGQAVKVSFTVSPAAPATVTPAGSVTVSDGVGDTCVATVAVGQCSLTISTAGAVTLTATYAGNSNFKGSTSPGVSQNASKAFTCTTITVHTPNPSVTGQPVTVSFTVKPVAPASGTPTGNVVVTDLIGDSCTATVAAGSCSIAFALPGSKLLVATYRGDSNYDGSITAQIPQNVVDFAVSASPSTEKVSPGGKTTYTVTLTPVNYFAGTVSLTCGAAPAGSTCAVSPSSVTLSGSASKTTTATITTAKSTPGGSYTLTFTGRYGSGSPSTGGLTHSANVTLTVH